LETAKHAATRRSLQVELETTDELQRRVVLLNSIESSLEQYELRCGAAAEACGRSEATIEQLQAALEARELVVSRLQQTVTSQEQSLELAYSLLDRQRDELDDAQATVRQLQAQQHLAGVATDIQQSGDAVADKGPLMRRVVVERPSHRIAPLAKRAMQQVQHWAVQLHTAAAEQQQQLLQLRDEATVTAQKLSEAMERANQVEQQLLTTTEYQHTTKELRSRLSASEQQTDLLRGELEEQCNKCKKMEKRERTSQAVYQTMHQHMEQQGYALTQAQQQNQQLTRELQSYRTSTG